MFRSRARLLSTAAVVAAAYVAGRRAGLVDGRVDGTLRTARVLVAAAAGARS